MPNPLSTGVLSGLTATVPMTLLMEFLHRRLPAQQRYPLPPRQITQRLTRRVGLEHKLEEPEHKTLALISHSGYGAATGAAYALLTDQLRPGLDRLPLPPAVRGAAQGMLFGLLVWAASYLGWLPAAGILPSATRQPKKRNALMIAAHLLWGAIVGALVERTQARNND